MILQVLNPDNYTLTIYAVPLLLVGGSIAALGLFVMIREHGSYLGLTFLFLALCISTWLLAYGADYASIDQTQALWWIRAAQAGVVFIPAGIIALTLAIIQRRQQFRIVLRAGLLLSFLFACGVYTGDEYISGLYHYSWGYYPRYGPFAVFAMAYLVCMMVFSLRLFWKEYRRSTTELHKKRLRAMILTFGSGYLGAIDILPALGIPLYAFGYIPVSIFVVSMAYIILRYRLVDITPELVTKQVLETMQGAVIVVDLEGRIRVINRTAQEMLGYQKTELIDSDLVLILPVLAEFKATVDAGERAVSHEMTWYGRNGRRFDVSVSASPAMDDRDRSFVGTVYIAHDITERKQAEERLRESLSLKRATLESTADGILVVNSQGKVVDFNNKFTELWGIPPDLMEQKDDDRLLQHVLSQLKNPESFVNKVRELYDHPYAEDFDEVQFKDGRIFERYSIPHRLEGKSVGRVWSFRSVSERKQAEEQLKNYSEELQDSNAELKSFIYSAAHDLRQPLVNIKGFTDEIVRSLQDIQAIVDRNAEYLPGYARKRLAALFEDDIQAAAGFVGSSVERMASIIDALLKLSQIGYRELRPETISMKDLVASSIRGLACQTREKNAAVIVNSLPDVTADRTALNQIMGNLLDNAVKYLDSGRPGRIEISGERTPTGVIYRVRDNGRGISRDDLPKLFNIFRRLGQLDVPGEGVGLAFVRALVRLHGGRIWCDSEEGVGSTFSFVIPRDHHSYGPLQEKTG